MYIQCKDCKASVCYSHDGRCIECASHYGWCSACQCEIDHRVEGGSFVSPETGRECCKMCYRYEMWKRVHTFCVDCGELITYHEQHHNLCVTEAGRSVCNTCAVKRMKAGECIRGLFYPRYQKPTYIYVRQMVDREYKDDHWALLEHVARTIGRRSYHVHDSLLMKVAGELHNDKGECVHHGK